MTSTTKAFVFKNRNEPVEYKEIALRSELGPNEIEVDTKYAALNPVDIKLKGLALWSSEWRTVRDFSGVVTRVGRKVTRFKVGDEVSGQAHVGYGNCTVIGSTTRIDIVKNGVMLKPQTMSLAESAATTLTFGTAYALATASPVKADSSVLVLGGATSVGRFLVQLLKRLYKVKRVVVTCSPGSAAELEALGADETVSYRDADYIAQLEKAAGAAKFHNVYDCAGGREVIDAIGGILQPASSGSMYASVSGDASFNGSYSSVVGGIVRTLPRVAFRLAFGRFYGLNYKMVGVTAKEWPDIAHQIIDEHHIKVKIASEFPAAEIEAAFEALDKAGGGKVVVKF